MVPLTVTLTSSDNFYNRKAVGQMVIFIIQGNDGGSIFTALTFDMSAAGAATFNNAVTAAALTVDDINLNTKIITITGDTNDTFTITSGANGGATTLATTDAGANGNLTLDADGDIRLDSNSGYGHVYLYNNGTKYAVFINSGNDFWIENDTNNGDTLFKGIDDGALFTALTLEHERCWYMFNI